MIDVFCLSILSAVHLVQASKSLGGFGSFGGLGRLKDLGGEPSQAQPGQPGQSGLGSEVQGHSGPSQAADPSSQGQAPDESPSQVPLTATAQVAQVLGAALRSSTSGILAQD